MSWEQLLSLKRFGDQNERPRYLQNNTRLGFDVDYDRIIFSSAFRGLQDKTQVMPMPIHLSGTSNFVHTRLTHSLEVSVVGRSLGRMVGKEIIDRHKPLNELGYHFNDFGAIVATAALAHDIGNPPFGHSGEKAMGEFFRRGKGSQYKNRLTQEQFYDLSYFEGNANGFRLLTHHADKTGGLRLSYATLGAFIKYPKASLPLKPNMHVQNKKYGYFQQQKSFFDILTAEIGLRNPAEKRHPLVYLVEAADDICYTLIDFEDGINLGLLSEDYALEYLINLVRESINTKKYHSLSSTSERLAYLRALSIATLINEASEIFLDNEQKIMDGSLENPLLHYSKYKAQIEDILNLSVDKIYHSNMVLDREISGYRILGDLLEIYATAVEAHFHDKGISNYEKLLLKSLPDNFPKHFDTLYDALLETSCFVASLSDSAAVQLHERIMGKVG